MTAKPRESKAMLDELIREFLEAPRAQIAEITFRPFCFHFNSR